MQKQTHKLNTYVFIIQKYMKNKKWLLLFITVVICFAMPSIIYLAKNQSIYNFIFSPIESKKYKIANITIV